MATLFQTHSGREAGKVSRASTFAAAQPTGGDVAVDEQADFGYLFPPSSSEDDYLLEVPEIVAELDALGNLMVDAAAGDLSIAEIASSDSSLAPVFTYWGQFLDHELTARTDRESDITNLISPHPPADVVRIESKLRNARTPRFDLDSVYGGLPTGPGVTKDAVTVISGMRHPRQPNKMRVGTAIEKGPLPDDLDEHRDLPRFVQVQQPVRDAALRLAQSSLQASEFEKYSATLDQRAIIGDNRNDENLVVAQFHVSFLRFHNKTVDFLAGNDVGWVPDFAAAQTLTRLHYQWLIVEGYLKAVCEPGIVDKVVAERAQHFFKFRSEYDSRRTNSRLGNALPLEFSVAAFRFGHSMVRKLYDYNRNFGRKGSVLPNASLDLLFNFTGGGNAISDNKKLPKNWVIDWARFIGISPLDASDGQPARFARKIDTELAPPLGKMVKEANDVEDAQLKEMFKHLARRNLRRGYNLKLPTGQALHKYLKQVGAIDADPIDDVSTIFVSKPEMRSFLAGTATQLHTRTPLWFYVLAEAEAAGGNRLGKVGSWLVASTFVGVLLADPDSALSTGFTPEQSPLRTGQGNAIDSVEQWMRFAAVLE